MRYTTIPLRYSRMHYPSRDAVEAVLDAWGFTYCDGAGWLCAEPARFEPHTVNIFRATPSQTRFGTDLPWSIRMDIVQRTDLRALMVPA